MRPRPFALLSVLLAAAPAAAQTEPFQEAFDEAVAAFQARDYDTALQRFQRSYILSRRPEILFNVGLTLERVGRRDDAVATLRQFISLQPTSPQRADAERHIAALLATPVAPTPVAPTPVAPTPVAVVAPPPRAIVPPPRAVAPARPLWPWITLGGGAAAGIAGVVLLATASDPGADASVLTEAQYLSAVDGNDARRVAGAVLLGLGGAAVVAGVVGLVRAPSSPRERASIGVYGWPVAGGGVVGVTGRAF